MEHAIYSVTLLALLAAISHVQAQEIGDPQKGLALARSVCSECHAIGREQVRSPNAPWWRAAALGRCTDQPRLPLAGLDVQRAERNTTGHARRLVWALAGRMRSETARQRLARLDRKLRAARVCEPAQNCDLAPMIARRAVAAILPAH
jgi:hypothetical protein